MAQVIISSGSRKGKQMIFSEKLGDVVKSKHEVLVVFASRKSVKGKSQVNIKCTGKDVSDRVKNLFDEKIFGANLCETLFLRDVSLDHSQHLVLVGLGNDNEITADSFRRAGGSLYRNIRSNKSKKVTICGQSASLHIKKYDVFTQALVEGMVIASYQFDDFKSENDRRERTNLPIEIYSPTAVSKKAVGNGIKAGNIISESVNFARWLGDLPGNILTPDRLSKEAQKAAKGTGIKVTVWNKARIIKEKMGLLNGVSLGSLEEPRFIIMEYKGAAASKKPICLVGKGLTFDSGGISLKPSPSMEEMKFDMCGGANTIASIVAIAKLKLKVNVMALIPASENMPGARANKPGDILKARNGTTVEVNNTDAEGRLILADALCYAVEKKPAAIFVMATLTGAMVIALGNLHTGYFTMDESLSKKIDGAGNQSLEKLWRMPLLQEHIKDMTGHYADLNNMGPDRGAGSSRAAGFLKSFVPDELPYAHFDIAGTAWNSQGRLQYLSGKGASGVMVRTYVELARNWK